MTFTLTQTEINNLPAPPQDWLDEIEKNYNESFNDYSDKLNTMAFNKKYNEYDKSIHLWDFRYKINPDRYDWNNLSDEHDPIEMEMFDIIYKNFKINEKIRHDERDVKKAECERKKLAADLERQQLEIDYINKHFKISEMLL